ncbi:Ubiquitin-conjugating enzyme E2 [Penicillium hispanicum]|uniref:Ubiquitin-conjugating enzyme E2 n=1 Tax=Penicillium hispanicum TaxID=1080232 RepID=UPI002541A32C|nr:Ubiquitin-conjugating enzyme E2 [Penicillium hispanicum]KAJ5594487.1 Ubiquitin-conjugating enzyme E2 [Penicillium hispanicum]
MPTKDFHRDVCEAATPGRYLHLRNIKSGEYDGSISFTFRAPEEGVSIDFQAIVSDAHDYPQTHNFFVFSTTENVATSVANALEAAQPLFTGIDIHDVLTSVDRIVSDAVQADGDQQDDRDVDTSDQDMIDMDDVSDWDAEESLYPEPSRLSNVREKIRRDLRVVKNAGFKIGFLGDVTGSLIVSVSCRIGRLGLSEEAMHAWNVRSSEYLVLLIRYPGGYQDLQEILKGGENTIQMRIGLCDSYKPSPRNAMYAFQGLLPTPKKDPTSSDHSDSPDEGLDISLRELFIGGPINTLLNERLLGITKLRIKHALSWTGAELLFHAFQGKALTEDDANVQEYEQPDSWSTSPPEVLVSDHLAEMGLAPSKVSFPLLSLQFALRHFVRCPEFCLVCHCKTDDSFEALKPYVCSNGLCLYQYITFGMGPSLEYEIRSQPLVVDMLISLAYSRAKSGYLADFPTGLGLQVPDVSIAGPSATVNIPVTCAPLKTHTATFNAQKMSLSDDKLARLSVNDWIVILDPVQPLVMQYRDSWHCHVQEVGESSQHVNLSLPICRARKIEVSALLREFPTPRKVRYVVYNANFDDLTPTMKQTSIVMLLDTLPSVDTLTEFLSHSKSEKPLSSLRDCVSPAALDLLRWIVASNRSCILQDSNGPEHQVSGMKGYVQFRLVQGAPDKEQRFVQAVRSNSLAINPDHPTIFAWHGSAIHNWHSILREGLHFKNIINGRACGHGVYMSSHFQTSQGFCHSYSEVDWPQSKLQMHSMLSLNEVVNHTKEFVCAKPHYVVQHLDWIQPRYLFVGSKASWITPSTDEKQQSPNVIYKQDLRHQAMGPTNKPIQIPISAINSRRRHNVAQVTSKTCRETEFLESKDIEFDDCESISTMMEDINVLLSDCEPEDLTKKTPLMSTSETDFVPGTLKGQSLPLMAPPRYATTMATKILQSHLQATIKVQEREKLHELGWYVDPNLITTVYQWIVELHTFDPALPLAKDLKAANLQSVVLELRFPPQFPMNPPFVRVIRPRFLEFAAGGGGHVTAGGAMCMELLTSSGWSPVTSIESVLLQVRMAMSNTEPRPGRLARGSHQQDYSVSEAIWAFKRACLNHGWDIPSDMELISW